jgi:hypothetical protein
MILFGGVVDGLVGSSTPIKALAVVGGAAVGGVLLGLVTQLLVRLAAAKQVPPWPLRGVRLGGAVAGGWLVYLWLFGVGGGGLGGPGGGWWPGAGQGPEKEKEAAAKDAKKEKKGTQDEDQAETVRVEVLGDATLEKIAGGTKFDPERRYRFQGRDDRRLRTLAEVKARVKALHEKQGVKKIKIVLYYDAPDQANATYVSPLAAWARELFGEEAVGFEELGEKAPAE